MNKRILSLCLLAALLPLAGCVGGASSTTASGSPAATLNTTAFYQSSANTLAYGATSAVLYLSHGDTADLAEKKAILDQVVTGLKTYRAISAPGAVVAAQALTFLPDKPHWQSFSTAIHTALDAMSGPEAWAAIDGLISGIQSAEKLY